MLQGLLSPRAPLLVFAVFSLLAGLLTLLLPETRGRVLPDTIAEGEFFHTQRALPCSRRKSHKKEGNTIILEEKIPKSNK